VSAAPAVSVVVPAYRSARTIGACLEALRRQRVDGVEVVVVNSSPEDRTGAIVTRGFPEVRYVESERRLLPHAARNLGAAEARGEVIVFTDPDCEAAPDWLERLLAAQAAGHQVVVGSMGVADRGRFARGVHFVKFWWLLPGLEAGPRWIAPTANAAYSRRMWEEVGPFDESLFASDGLTSWHAALSGQGPWFEPRARVDHRHPGHVGALWRERRARGEEFGEIRMSWERWSRARAVAHALLFPALAALVLARSGRSARRAGWLSDWLTTLPTQVVGQVGWSAGEARAHLRRAAGRSAGGAA
jgi:glycosyltransferase involved in cell wall biosynthesis